MRKADEYRGLLIDPAEQGGFRVRGEYRPTLAGAMRYAKGYSVPDEEEVNDSKSAADYEDESLDRRLLELETRKERLNSEP